MYEKYLRNIELEEIERRYIEESASVACGLGFGSLPYPTRPPGKHQFVPVGGFKQHPNESQEM